MPVNPFLSIKKKPAKPSANQTNAIKASSGSVAPEKVKAPSQADLILNRAKHKEENNITKVPAYIKILKISSITLLIVVLAVTSFLALDLAEDNKFLGILGYQDNTRTSFEKLKKEDIQLQGEVSNLESTKIKLENKIENNIFSENTETIESIKAQQITWFDTIDINGEFQIGLFDLPNHLGGFINGGNFDKALSETRNKVVIENITANRNSLAFNFEAANLFGKVFNLTQEFISFINASPKLSGVSISSFSRSTEKDLGWDSMSLGVNAKLQGPEDVDEFDDEEVYKLFSNWVKGSAKQANANNSTQLRGSQSAQTNGGNTTPTSPVRLTPR